MKIYIPSRGRVGLQKTVERLGRDINRRFDTVVVCPPNEVTKLKNEVMAHEADVMPCKAEGISATRQWILDHARKNKEGVALMLDDDLPTWRKRSGEKNERQETPYTKATTKEIEEGLATFAKLMEGYAHGSIGHALFCQVSPPIKYNSRMLRALAYNVDHIPKDVKFRLPVMEDFDMELQLLTRGFSSLTYNGIVQDQHQNNSEGGCSSYRTLEVQAAAAHELHRLWPSYVTVVTRAPSREWIGMGGERTDVRVNWRAAAKAGGA